MKYSFALFVLATFAISGCSKEGMPTYDGSNPSAYFKEHCLNKPSTIQDTEQCRKARSDTTMRAIAKEPS